MFESTEGDSWTEAAKLLAADGAFYALFGFSVSVYENVIVVGAPGNDANSGS